jgi:hypothetical protein
MSKPQAEIMDIMAARIAALQLDTTKTYTMIITQKDGIETTRYVGRFLRAYTVGSGDGQERYHEFVDDSGAVSRVSDHMWSGRQTIDFVVN